MWSEALAAAAGGAQSLSYHWNLAHVRVAPQALTNVELWFQCYVLRQGSIPTLFIDDGSGEGPAVEMEPEIVRQVATEVQRAGGNAADGLFIRVDAGGNLYIYPFDPEQLYDVAKRGDRPQPRSDDMSTALLTTFMNF